MRQKLSNRSFLVQCYLCAVPEKSIFQVMRNGAFSGTDLPLRDTLLERQLLVEVDDALRARLPASWEMQAELLGDRHIDGVMSIVAPDGSRARLFIEVKRRIDPRDVEGVVDQLRKYAGPSSSALVVAPFVSKQTRDLLDAARVGYLDVTGNIRLIMDEPAVYISDVGATTNPWKDEDRPLRSLKGPAAGRIVRALCDFSPPFGVQELAKHSGASAASVSRVISLLEREVIVTRTSRGAVTQVAWEQLIERWTDDYSLASSNRTSTYLEPRGMDALLGKLRNITWTYAVTGSLATVQIAPVASPRLAVIFVEDIAMAAEKLDVRRAERGANVLLVEPFDPVVFERTFDLEGVTYAAHSQIAADLLTSPGRGPEEGEELLRWMRSNERGWRRSI